MAVQLSLENAEGRITHHLNPELKKYPLEMKCLYGWSCAVWGSRQDQNSHLFQVSGLHHSRAYMWKAGPKLRGAHPMLPTGWPFPVHDDSASHAGLVPYSQLQEVAAAALPSGSYSREGLTFSPALGTGEGPTPRGKASAHPPTQTTSASLSWPPAAVGLPL